MSFWIHFLYVTKRKKEGINLFFIWKWKTSIILLAESNSLNWNRVDYYIFWVPLSTQKISFHEMLGKVTNNLIVRIVIIFAVVNISSHGVTSHNDDDSSIVSTHTNSSSVVKSRAKRYLIFQPGSRILVREHRILSFISWIIKLSALFVYSLSQFRINVKDDIIKNNTIFGHGWGFRANIDLLQPYRPPKPKARKIRRREVYGTLEELINQHGELVNLCGGCEMREEKPKDMNAEG